MEKPSMDNTTESTRVERGIPHNYACDSLRCVCYREGYIAGVKDGKLKAEHSDGPDD
jgi:hypothetical protein